MADSFSPLLGLRLQQTGNNQNTWGDLLNSDTITPLENAVAGRVSHPVTGGTLDLSASPLVEQVQIFTGTLTADQTIIIPNLSKAMKVWNATSGSFSLVIKTASGTAARIPGSTIKDVYCDAGNNVFRLDASEVGEIKHFGRTSAPPGYLVCDGSAISRTGYPDLFAAIGTTWGAGNGATTFNLPDLVTNNRYLRASGGSLSVGQTQADDIKPHSHTASGSTSVSLSIAGDGAWTPSISISDPTHSHQAGAPNAIVVVAGTGISFSAGTGLGTVNSTNNSATGITATSSSIGNHTHSGSSASASTNVTVNNSSGTETRPHSAIALVCIRY